MPTSVQGANGGDGRCAYPGWFLRGAMSGAGIFALTGLLTAFVSLAYEFMECPAKSRPSIAVMVMDAVLAIAFDGLAGIFVGSLTTAALRLIAFFTQPRGLWGIAIGCPLGILYGFFSFLLSAFGTISAPPRQTLILQIYQTLIFLLPVGAAMWHGWFMGDWMKRIQKGVEEKNKVT